MKSSTTSVTMMGVITLISLSLLFTLTMPTEVWSSDSSSSISEWTHNLLSGEATRRTRRGTRGPPVQTPRATIVLEQPQPSPAEPVPVEFGPELAEPTCTDSIKNQEETDVDCGASGCKACNLGQTCLSGGNCLSGQCEDGICAPGDAGAPCTTGDECRSGHCVSGGCARGDVGTICIVDGHCITGLTCIDGLCGKSEPVCDPKQGTPCNRNQCGGTGIVQCDGTCSAAAPNVPPYLGEACNRNECGGTGVYQCDGLCSEEVLSIPSTFGDQCGCGGTIQCDGTCNKAGCSGGQVCQNSQCVTSLSGTCGSCSTDSNCQSGLICYYGKCIRDGAQGPFPLTYSYAINPPIRPVQMRVTCQTTGQRPAVIGRLNGVRKFQHSVNCDRYGLVYNIGSNEEINTLQVQPGIRVQLPAVERDPCK